MSLSSSGVVVFEWLQALSGLAALFTWGSICLAHIRFRSAWKFNGHTVDELPFKSAFGIGGSWFGLILIVLVLIGQFYTALFPPGSDEPPSVEAFFQAYLALPVVLLFWVLGYLWKGKAWLRVSQIDVHSGMREHNWEEIKETNARKAALPRWRKILALFF